MSTPPGVSCQWPGSEENCEDHYEAPSSRVRQYQVRPENSGCSVEGCGGVFLAKGLCRKHYASFWKYGDPLKKFRGDKGAGSFNKDGYHIITVNGKQVIEHRHVVSEFIGRPLREDEDVHHRNGCRSDNRISNLELWSTSQPRGQKIEDKIAWAREWLDLYQPIEGLCVILISSNE